MKKQHGGVGATVVDPTIKFVTVKIDDAVWSLAWVYGELAAAEKALGDMVEDLDDKGRVVRRRFVRFNLLTSMAMLISGSPSITDIGALFYASLRPAHPDITMEQVGRLCRFDTLGDIKEAIYSSWVESIPEASKAPLDPPEGGMATA